MYVGLLAEPDHPLAWRGPVLHKIITQFIHAVEWGRIGLSVNRFTSRYW
ncbi:P-loop NTPase [Dolichospermum circinale]|nr:P-loop NTPase [Dolichospermum circinale]MDB9451598.1 P-loop NTPase [Dolichospermum circinale CS-547]